MVLPRCISRTDKCPTKIRKSGDNLALQRLPIRREETGRHHKMHIDKIHEKIRKESQLTDLKITKSMEAVMELTRKVQMMMTGGIEQSKMLNEVQLRVNQQTEVVKETFADMVKKNTEGQERVQQPEAMRKIMKDALTEQEKENTDMERRHQNHTIYGVKDSGKGEQLKREDEAYVKELFDNHLGLMNLKPKAITRLGKVWEGDESRRPLRVIYNNIEEERE